MAKTEKLKSEADAIDLDFVKKEDGSTHAEDVDRITSQAYAQGKAKIVENALKPKETKA